MTAPIRVLICEDVADDAELVMIELRRAGHDPIMQRVCTPEALEAALEQPWDVVVSDYSMPRMKAPEALAIVRKRAPNLPFIVVSGSVGEEIAVQLMKAGAHDFFLKDKLQRLPSAIEREIRDANERAERQRAESQLRAMFEQAIVGIAQVDPAEHFELVNEEYGAIAGRSRPELLNMRLRDIVHADDRAGYAELFARTFSGGTNETSEHRLDRPDGKTVWALNSLSPIRDARGKAIAAVSVMNDITERKQAVLALEESEHRFRKMADSAPVMLWMTDAAGDCAYVNKQWRELTGVEPKCSGPCWLDVVHPDDAETVHQVVRRALDRREPFRVEYRMQRHDGSYGWALDTGIPRFDGGGELLGFIGSVIDITDRKTIEQERERVVDDLSRTIRLSETFVGVLSHDLRNPLSAITTGAHLMLQWPDAPERMRMPLSRVLNSANRMARMIDQLLDFTRMRTGGIQIDPKPVDLAELVQGCVDEILLANTRVDIRVEALGTTSGVWDRDRLSQVVSNLVANAAQHRTANTPVVVRIDGRERGFVQLSVHNDGVIPSDMLPSIFEPFRARVGRGSGSSGLGLGLYISEQVARAHGGEIRVTSDAESGTELVVMLPRTANASPPVFADVSTRIPRA